MRENIEEDEKKDEGVVRICRAEEVIGNGGDNGDDDSGIYRNEQLRNINRYYFNPFLDESIPYKPSVLGAVEERRDQLKSLMQLWNDLSSNTVV